MATPALDPDRQRADTRGRSRRPDPAALHPAERPGTARVRASAAALPSAVPARCWWMTARCAPASRRWPRSRARPSPRWKAWPHGMRGARGSPGCRPMHPVQQALLESRGAPVRLLHEWHRDEERGAARPESASHRGRRSAPRCRATCAAAAPTRRSCGPCRRRRSHERATAVLPPRLTGRRDFLRAGGALVVGLSLGGCATTDDARTASRRRPASRFGKPRRSLGRGAGRYVAGDPCGQHRHALHGLCRTGPGHHHLAAADRSRRAGPRHGPDPRRAAGHASFAQPGRHLFQRLGAARPAADRRRRRRGTRAPCWRWRPRSWAPMRKSSLWRAGGCARASPVAASPMAN